MPEALLSVLLITVGPAAVVVAETKQKRERSIDRSVGMGLPREGRANGHEILVEHWQCGAWLVRNFLICLFDDRN